MTRTKRERSPTKREIDDSESNAIFRFFFLPFLLFFLSIVIELASIFKFSPKELEARIKSLLRRSKHLVKNSSSRPQKIVKIGNVIIDFNTRTIETKYSKVKLTGIEYSLLELLIDNPGKQLSRSKILNNVWGYTPERYVDTRIVDVHISRLRSKLELDPVNPELIITVRGIGYMFRK